MLSKPNLLDFTFQELEEFTHTLKLPKYRTAQLWEWIWVHNADDFSCMTNIPKETRSILEREAVIFKPEIVQKQTSSDGTIKLLLQLADGECVETVLIPSSSKEGKDRLSQCLSTQVGCAMACTFCSTASLGFTRNMSMGEILGQVQVARKMIGDTRPERPLIRNLVYMGMGEPLLNFDALMNSLETLHHPKGLAFSSRRITVSTCGIQKGLLELGQSNLAYLAVSLHAPNQALREKLMPKAAQWHLDDLIKTLESYPLSAREHITLEYLVIEGLNDGPQEIKELIRICSRLKAKLNLIPYNPSYGTPYKSPSPENLLAFEKALWSKKITAIVRKSKGQDIDAACGQLRAKYLNS